MDNWIIQDTIDFLRPEYADSKKAPHVLMLPGDDRGHTWEITCMVGKEPADLSGASVVGYFLRADGATVIVNGTVSDNVASVTLSPECYAVSGGMRGLVRIDKNNQVVPIREGSFIVQLPIGAGAVISGGEAIPSLPALLAQIHTLQQATNAAILALGVSGLTSIRYDEPNETLIINQIPLTSDTSYATAVSLGYEGTEEEWNAFIALVSENSAAITQAQEDAAEALAVAQDGISHSETITVLPTDWVGDDFPYVATVQCSIAKANNNLLVGIGGGLTTQEQAVISSSSIMCTGQGAGTITLTAYSYKPDISFPINVMEVK